MAMPKELVGSPISAMIKQRYNLDDLEIDGSTRMFTQLEADVVKESQITYYGLFMKPRIEKRKREFYHLRVKWRIGKDAWYALVPVEVALFKTQSSGLRAYFQQGYVHKGFDWDIQNEETINNICKVIEESQGIKDENKGIR